MIEIVNITRPLYADELDAIEREADLENRKSKTEMAAVLIREAVVRRVALRQNQAHPDDSNMR
jgi:glutamine amidotransferase PdxT